MSGLVLIAAGGTGGHMFPAEALAAALSARGRAVALVTDRRGAQYAGRPGAFWGAARIHTVAAATPAGRNLFGAAVAILAILRGVVAARRLVRRLRPSAVVGFGGYPSLPPMIAARLEGIVTVLHEQNAALGKVNRLIAPRVRALALSHAKTRFLPARTAEVAITGNPVRPAIRRVRSADYPDPARPPLHLLVIGGSQGAAVLAEIVPAALAGLPAALRARLFVTQQARPENVAAVVRTLSDTGIAHEVAPFFDDIAERLRRAHLVVARAGASTVAELACAGRPSILIPLPAAADDHQTLNALELAAAGGARVISQTHFTAEWLAETLGALLDDPAALGAMAEGARGAARPDAEARLADLVERLLPPDGDHGAPAREARAA